MQRPDFAAMSDPAMNRQFARAWVDPPDEDSRKRRPGGGNADFGTSVDGNERNLTAAERARQDAERLFAPKVAA